MTDKPHINVTEIYEGWILGNIYYANKKYVFNIKRFEEGSKYGINGGCISKLFIWDNQSATYLVSYERGWVRKPQNETMKKVYMTLVRKFNRGLPPEYVSAYWSHGTTRFKTR